ncbi:hypothetical protein [Anaerovorax odorimutans]|uniref:hypothetical protein n=1 Tax=Anaerovorax odorimutans TaxID=109327 RepID=UPI000403E970|nr:hypothetical protein [Anaerovorax odorimutans]
MSERIDTLVICSTLNQITNYLMIKKYKPKNIFNITYSDSKENDKWDQYLDSSIEENITNIEIDIKDLSYFEDVKKIIKEKIKDIEEIYWHITGGQRLISLAIKDIIRDREKDKFLYIEGNTEKLMINDYKFENSIEEDYFDCNLTFGKALKLVGFKLNDKSKDKSNKSEDIKSMIEKQIKQEDEEKYNFYVNLYDFLNDEKEENFFEIRKCYIDSVPQTNKKDKKIEFTENYKTSYKNALLFSNRLKESIQKKYIKEVFEKIKKEDKDNKLDINKDKGFNNLLKNQSPIGYIFENIIFYKICSILEKKDSKHNKIVDIIGSMKTLSERKEIKGIVDELDIALLTSTGKIINLECKSGGMSGDNAKSNKYTTYRLSGVFGMPYLVSLLKKNEDLQNEKEEFIVKNIIGAYNSAKRAELNVINFDELEEEIEKIIK